MVTAVEEFGIAAVEVQAAGRPVIAAGGGALETVVEGVTGTLWSGGVEELMDAVTSFDPAAVDPEACVQNANRFNVAAFRREFPRQVAAAIAARSAEPRGLDSRAMAARRTPRRRGGLARPLR